MKKFKSTTGAPVRIALLSGHATWVGTELAELDERFHSEAYAARCVSEDMIKNKAMESIPTRQAEAIVHVASLDDRILKVIKEMVDANELGHFTKSGAPDAQVISTRIGERISSQKRDSLWFKFQKDAEAE